MLHFGKIPKKFGENLARFSKKFSKILANFAKILKKSAKISAIFNEIIDPLVPKDMFRLVCLVKLVFFAREGVAF